MAEFEMNLWSKYYDDFILPDIHTISTLNCKSANSQPFVGHSKIRVCIYHMFAISCISPGYHDDIPGFSSSLHVLPWHSLESARFKEEHLQEAY